MFKRPNFVRPQRVQRRTFFPLAAVLPQSSFDCHLHTSGRGFRANGDWALVVPGLLRTTVH
ncbi:hypothetical protein M378DRAFT_163459 [Amanita muscaria Koide BX008]|uniref:Uncharacterized protein n=1 Tax=Amanita muscaria (strain Koide BX008) TaxID=946122 RepID=A0A0C2TBU3_AMAMK|nr:hypothetical protein M378DRAFT_163459 [Amanita muscaria Koide BX008]